MVKQGAKNALGFIGNAIIGKIEDEMDEYHARVLIRKAKNGNETERIIAQAKLKKDYPEVYSVLRREMRETHERRRVRKRRR